MGTIQKSIQGAIGSIGQAVAVGKVINTMEKQALNEAIKLEEKGLDIEKKVAPAPKKANGPMIKVTLVKSGSGRLEKQIRTLKALGLNKTNSSNIVPDNAATRGMIFVVKHLVSVEEVK